MKRIPRLPSLVKAEYLNFLTLKNFTYSRAFLTACLLSVFSQALGQEPSRYQPAKIIPPSPTAASLGVYGDLSVGYYSGTPDISIPLYDIATPNHSLPIRVQYNASGVRVSENAGWVGLGWSLSAGGVITRTVRGMDDFSYRGYYTAGALPHTDGGNNYNADNPDWVTDKQYFDAILEGDQDGEPDILSYNFGNYSGKLALGKQADGSPVFMSERNNLRVEYLTDTFNWKITDANGYVYYFGTKEWTREYHTYSSDAAQIEADATLDRFTYSQLTADNTTAWYLDSIVSPTSEAVRFFYARRGESFGLVSTSEKAYNLLKQQVLTETGTCNNSTPDLKATYNFFNASKPTLFDAYLDSIAFQNGSVKFKATDRADIEYPSSNASKPGKLSEIIIRDRRGDRVKRYLFQYSYFNNDATKSGRLRLDAIAEYGSTDQDAKPPYQFTYFNPNSLPSKYAVNKIDHWGYYNGANNKTLLPPKTLKLQNFPGADRSPASAEVLKTGVLSSITYPTGGSTHFDFEPHEYANLRGEEQFTLVQVDSNVYSAPTYIYPKSNETAVLEFTDTTAVTFYWSYEKADENAADLMNVETVYGEVRNESTGQVFIGFSNKAYCGANDPSGYCFVTSDDEMYVMPPGRYIMSVSPQQGYITRASASWKAKVPIAQRAGGGIRIKSIINYDSLASLQNGKPAKVRRFYYTEDEKPGGRSVGKLISSIQYDYQFTFYESNPYGCNYYGDYLARMSSSVYPMGLSSKGTVVGYDKVTEVIGENGEGGKNVYYFHNAEDYLDPVSYPGSPTYSHPLGGKMAVMATLDAAGTLLRKVDYIYRTKETFNLKGVKLYSEPTFSKQISLGNYYIKYYDSASSWNVLSSEEERTYSSGNGTIVTVKRNYYDNPSHREVTRQHLLVSDGSTVIKKYKYPGDYTAAGSGSFVAQMNQKNIVSPVIEEQTLLKKGGATKLLSGSFTEYKLIDGRFYKPGVIYRLESSHPLPDTTESSVSDANQVVLHPGYRPEVYLEAYTPLGNMAQHRKSHGNRQAYLWGYNHSLPIAEVRNATYAEVEAALGGGQAVEAMSGSTTLTQAQLDQLKGLRNLLPNALVTIYTHDPLVGVTSITDPNGRTTSYEYDGLGRLQAVKDEEGNVLQSHEYHYAGQ